MTTYDQRHKGGTLQVFSLVVPPQDIVARLPAGALLHVESTEHGTHTFAYTAAGPALTRLLTLVGAYVWTRDTGATLSRGPIVTWPEAELAIAVPLTPDDRKLKAAYTAFKVAAGQATQSKAAAEKRAEKKASKTAEREAREARIDAQRRIAYGLFVNSHRDVRRLLHMEGRRCLPFAELLPTFSDADLAAARDRSAEAGTAEAVLTLLCNEAERIRYSASL